MAGGDAELMTRAAPALVFEAGLPARLMLEEPSNRLVATDLCVPRRAVPSVHIAPAPAPPGQFDGGFQGRLDRTA